MHNKQSSAQCNVIAMSAISRMQHMESMEADHKIEVTVYHINFIEF